MLEWTLIASKIEKFKVSIEQTEFTIGFFADIYWNESGAWKHFADRVWRDRQTDIFVCGGKSDFDEGKWQKKATDNKANTEQYIDTTSYIEPFFIGPIVKFCINFSM